MLYLLLSEDGGLALSELVAMLGDLDLDHGDDVDLPLVRRDDLVVRIRLGIVVGGCCRSM